ncbi:DUF2959 domain-containing protein [Thalassotalea piscium]|uniref:CRISPR/Cas system CMR-associated protein Cmr5 small subunit n=1 Tax=Thalassotalea piscium TaxID=1230533 RepID=A0A7X0NJN9_9GAMM|nr:DUF2959 domain-containing protein [Thalassotalea piscium]MBB6544683.1 CRISPR/Cas system CMR-associated protein Cmr5 small subunit [Thalassotalea piscium]
MTKINAFIIALLLTLTACSSAYYSAMEKVGIHKRDILIDRVEEANDSQEEVKEEFASALAQFSSLITFDGGELETHYQQSKAHYESSEQAAKDVSDRIDAIENVAEALFDEWQDEIEQYSNASLKRQSQSKLRQTQRNYRKVIIAMQSAEKKMAPVLTALKDNMLYLKHNLNAQAVGALKGEYQSIKRDIDVLIKEMNNSIDDSQAFINTLKAQ